MTDFGDDQAGVGRTGYLECDTFEALMQACLAHGRVGAELPGAMGRARRSGVGRRLKGP